MIKKKIKKSKNFSLFTEKLIGVFKRYNKQVIRKKKRFVFIVMSKRD